MVMRKLGDTPQSWLLLKTSLSNMFILFPKTKAAPRYVLFGRIITAIVPVGMIPTDISMLLKVQNWNAI
jgi:hypothetical protein